MRKSSQHWMLWVLMCLAPSALIADEPKVHLIATGGTIAQARGGVLTAKQLTELDPRLARLANVSVEDVTTIGSSRMTPGHQLAIAERINSLFHADQELSGIVVTHGTDSMEETAFLVDLLVDDARPVVFTGAMRPPKRDNSDAVDNLMDAVRVAASAKTRGLGVVVVMNGEIHAARDVRKSNTKAADAMASPGLGPIGFIDSDSIFLARRPLRRITLDVDSVEPRVTLLRLYTGSDGSDVLAAADSGARGIVLEVFGRGNAPPQVMDAVRQVGARGVIVVFTARVGAGRVVLGDDAKRAGVISGEDLDGLKARLVLVAALGESHDRSKIQSYFERLAGLVDE